MVFIFSLYTVQVQLCISTKSSCIVITDQWSMDVVFASETADSSSISDRVKSMTINIGIYSVSA